MATPRELPRIIESTIGSYSPIMDAAAKTVQTTSAARLVRSAALELTENVDDRHGSLLLVERMAAVIRRQQQRLPAAAICWSLDHEKFRVDWSE